MNECQSKTIILLNLLAGRFAWRLANYRELRCENILSTIIYSYSSSDSALLHAVEICKSFRYSTGGSDVKRSEFEQGHFW